MAKGVTIGFALGGAVLIAILLYHRNAVLFTETATTDGAAIYGQACAHCHGPRGKGRGGFTPPLRGRSLPLGTIKEIVRDGRNKMPGQPYIRGEGLDNLAEFVRGMN